MMPPGESMMITRIAIAGIVHGTATEEQASAVAGILNIFQNRVQFARKLEE